MPARAGGVLWNPSVLFVDFELVGVVCITVVYDLVRFVDALVVVVDFSVVRSCVVCVVDVGVLVFLNDDFEVVGKIIEVVDSVVAADDDFVAVVLEDFAEEVIVFRLVAVAVVDIFAKGVVFGLVAAAVVIVADFTVCFVVEFCVVNDSMVVDTAVVGSFVVDLLSSGGFTVEREKKLWALFQPLCTKPEDHWS